MTTSIAQLKNLLQSCTNRIFSSSRSSVCSGSCCSTTSSSSGYIQIFQRVFSFFLPQMGAEAKLTIEGVKEPEFYDVPVKVKAKSSVSLIGIL